MFLDLTNNILCKACLVKKPDPVSVKSSEISEIIVNSGKEPRTRRTERFSLGVGHFSAF